MSQVHAQARTTPLLRAEIKASSASQSELASRYNVSVVTVRKWQGRDDPNDRSHRPHKLSTTMSPGQKAIAVELRKTLLLHPPARPDGQFERVTLPDKPDQEPAHTAH